MNKITIALLLGCLTACSTTPIGIEDRAGIATEIRQREASNKRIKDDAAFVPRIMQGFDKAIDKYFTARSAAPDRRAIRLRDTLDHTLRVECRKCFDLLIMKADDSRDRADRGIALVALGFTDDSEVQYGRGKRGKLTKKQVRVQNASSRRYTEMALNSLITGLKDPDDYIVERALLGLGLLAHENTPISDISMIIEDTKHSLDVRRNGSWALSVMQDKLTPDKRRLIRPIFQRILSQPLGDVEPPIVCHALHALGHHRNVLDAKIVEPYAKHPSALVRIRAAIAMGQIRSHKSVPVLLELILDSETNMNVRLAAHKSLKALAGGKDRGYDVKAWQHLFTLK